MASTAASPDAPATNSAENGVSLVRLYVLRAAYLVLVVGLGLSLVPTLITHDATARGVIPSLLGALWLLAFLGLRYPLQMLPLLLFELAWKTIWTLDFGLPQWFAGQRAPAFVNDFFSIAPAVVVVPILIPWGYVWRHYVLAPGARWR
ncbi:MAG TPA: hypothetical protein VKR31_10500 [Rhizomicrobium sp.]|nr:hypothetical protein [Rhizomicrobium sp.]